MDVAVLTNSRGFQGAGCRVQGSVPGSWFGSGFGGFQVRVHDRLQPALTPNPEPRTRRTEPGTWNRTMNPAPGTWNR